MMEPESTQNASEQESVGSGDLFAKLFNHLGADYLLIRPQGYLWPISLPVIIRGSRDAARAWTWNGSLESPTLKPSIKTTHEDGTISHIWLTDGMCEYLDDSTNGLAGLSLPLLSLANVPDQATASNTHG